jgi:uncharacterized HAD superfamily protein/hypoxanthine phosphoribosyltransferase
MFGYESVAQLAADVRANAHLIPRDVDLVVGIPRSGMIPAYLIGLLTNKVVIDVETFLANGMPSHGVRAVTAEVFEPLAAKHILVVDDSLTTGASMRKNIERIKAASFAGRIMTCAVIVIPSMRGAVDIFFREMPQPRAFEWNVLHHPDVTNSCFDLDGLLCVDPSERDNDDGPRYRAFLATAKPLFVPTQKIGHIVSARLEKYRVLTETWLRDHGIAYGKLHLIDLPSQAERIRLAAHVGHKADFYRRTDAFLFYESDVHQARQIARRSGKPVLCTTDMKLYLPDAFQPQAAVKTAKWHLKRPLGRIKGWLAMAAELGLL